MIRFEADSTDRSCIIFSRNEAIRFETAVGKEGAVLLPEVQEGEQVEEIVLKLASNPKPARKGGGQDLDSAWLR